MNGKKSKFEYDWFYDGTWGYNLFCVNKNKYTLEQAIAIFESETECKPNETSTATVRFGAGVSEDGEKRVCWYIDEEAKETDRRRCPVWVLEK